MVGPDERGDGEAYVYVLAKPPASPSSAFRGPSPHLQTSGDSGLPSSLLYMPGVYQVDPWTTQRHNLRAAPQLAAPIVGALLGGDVVDVAKVVTIQVPGGNDTVPAREHWAQLLRTNPGPPAWTLLASSGGTVFLRFQRRAGPRSSSPQSSVQRNHEPKSTSEISDLDRAIAELLGNPNVDESQVNEIIEQLTAHELETAFDEADTARLDRKRKEAAEQADKKETENRLKEFQQQATRSAEARRKLQRDIWEREQPKLTLRRLQNVAALDQSLSALDKEYGDRLKQLQEKRIFEEVSARAQDSSLWIEEPEASRGVALVGDVHDVKPLSAAGASALTMRQAKGAVSQAARGLAGVDDAPLAEALVAMEAATAFYYRKAVFEDRPAT